MANMTMGQRIAELRRKNNLTQEALAEKLGVTAQAVSKWENDASCPDISLIPRIAEIFNVSCDSLLGNESRAKSEPTDKRESTHKDNTISIKTADALGFPFFVILTGVQFLVAQLLSIDISIWFILILSALLGFGVAGCLKKRVSWFNIGMVFFGIYLGLLWYNIINIKHQFTLILAIGLVIWGICLMIDVFTSKKRGKSPHIEFNNNAKSAECKVDDGFVDCEVCFTEVNEVVTGTDFTGGDIEVSFGALTLDLTQCENIKDGARLEIEASFGSVKVLVPTSVKLEVAKDAAFGSVTTKGSADADASTAIRIDGSASFGSIEIVYR